MTDTRYFATAGAAAVAIVAGCNLVASMPERVKCPAESGVWPHRIRE